MADPINYTSRDFDTLVTDLRRRLIENVPEWTTYEAGLETQLLEMYAYVGDILNFYIDRMGNEAYLTTAVLRESVLNIAAMFGYTPSAQTAAQTTLLFSRVSTTEAITIPAGTQVYAQVTDQQPVFFETVAPLALGVGALGGTVTAIEGLTVPQEQVGSSTGQPDQDWVLYYPKVIKDSVQVFTADGPIDPLTLQPTLVEWTFFERIVDANFYNRAFSIYVDEEGYSHVRFGDNVNGEIPVTNVAIFATYRYGVGTGGNLGAGAIKSFVESTVTTDKLSAVTNTTAAQGGADAETIENMRTSIPQSLRTIERAVSTDDYANLALRVGGVAKAAASATVSTAVLLYVAPVGGGQPTPTLTASVQAYLNGPPSRKLIGTTVTITGPTYVPINMTLSVTVNNRYKQTSVAATVITVITNLYAFDKRAFGQLLSKGEVFKAVVGTPGVDYCDFSVFSRTPTGTADIQLAVNEIGTLAPPIVNATGGIT